MRTSIQVAVAIALMVLTTTPARADLIVYNMFGSVGELDPQNGQLLISEGIHEGDAIHLVVHVDTAAPDLCGQPGKGLYLLPFAAMDVDGIRFPPAGAPPGAWDVGYVEVNNAAGSCASPGDDQTGVAIRLLIGPVGMTLFGPGQIGESLPEPLFSAGGAGGFFGLAGNGFYGDVSFDDVRADVVPEPATLLLVASGLITVATRRRQR